MMRRGSIYDENRNVKTSCQLVNIVKYNGDYMELKFPESMLFFLYFCFQGRKYRLKDAVEQLGNAQETEIFPGIYFVKGKMNFFEELKDCVTKEKRYVIRNENKKDSFEICSELEKTKEFPYRKGKVIGCGIEYLNPQMVVQPVNLGGGRCGGCSLHSYFSLIGLMDGSYDGYYFFEEREIYEATSKEPFFLNCCMQSRCYETYKRIVDEGYSEDIDSSDQIMVTCEYGMYFADEGKHRICAMKRFGYVGNIPMRVTRMEEMEQDSNSNLLFETDYYADMKRIVESCYSRYEKLGISSESVKKLLNNPNATVLDYLKASKYSYGEIYKVCSEERDIVWNAFLQ